MRKKYCSIGILLLTSVVHIINSGGMFSGLSKSGEESCEIEEALQNRHPEEYIFWSDLYDVRRREAVNARQQAQEFNTYQEIDYDEGKEVSIVQENADEMDTDMLVNLYAFNEKDEKAIKNRQKLLPSVVAPAALEKALRVVRVGNDDEGNSGDETDTSIYD